MVLSTLFLIDAFVNQALVNMYIWFCYRMAPEVIACDEQPDATYDNRVWIHNKNIIDFQQACLNLSLTVALWTTWLKFSKFILFEWLITDYLRI